MLKQAAFLNWAILLKTLNAKFHYRRWLCTMTLWILWHFHFWCCSSEILAKYQASTTSYQHCHNQQHHYHHWTNMTVKRFYDTVLRTLLYGQVNCIFGEIKIYCISRLLCLPPIIAPISMHYKIFIIYKFLNFMPN